MNTLSRRSRSAFRRRSGLARPVAPCAPSGSGCRASASPDGGSHARTRAWTEPTGAPNHLPARRPARAGFTLIELMIVTIILGVLVTIAIKPISHTRERAMVAATKTQIRNALAAAERYRAVHGTLPDSRDRLTDLGYNDSGTVELCVFSRTSEPGSGDRLEIQGRHHKAGRVVVGRLPEGPGAMAVIDLEDAAAACQD